MYTGVHWERLLGLVRREVTRTVRKHHKQTRNALVSSYDKQKYAIKVQFQPEGTESGWIPLTAVMTGNKFGEQHAPNIKDQVQITDQEGEHMVGHVITRHYSTLDQPNPIEPGEYLRVHQTGSGFYHKSDGTLQHFGPQWWNTGQSGQGQSGDTGTGNNGTTTDPTQQGQQQQQQQQNAGKQMFQMNPDGSVVFNVPDQGAQGQGEPQNPQYTSTVKKDISHTSTEGNINGTAQQGSIQHTAQQNITHTASQQINNSAGTTYSRSAGQSISDQAGQISHNGNTNVNPNLNVAQLTTSLSYTQFSDRRIKRNFEAFTGALDKVLGLKVQWFEIYKSETVHDNGDREVIDLETPHKTFGLVAQEAREVVPEIVRGNEDEQMLSLDEAKIGMLTLAALQEYVAKNEQQILELKARIAELESCCGRR